MRSATKIMVSLGLAFSLLAGLSSNSLAFIAQDRPLPSDGVLGVFRPAAIPKIVIDNKEVVMSAGAQIRNQKNVIVQTGAIKGADVNVLYEKNKLGQIQRMWILTDEEYERIKSGAKPNLLPGMKAASTPTAGH